MTDDDDITRHSIAETAELIQDPNERARREASNALLQAERVKERILEAIDGRPFKLRPSTVLDLNRCAIEGLNSYAGNYRPGAVEIQKSQHIPPGAHQVPEFVEEMCDYVNDNWETRTAVHLSSFVMWRLNWIHPFADGNGRTSRATSYLVLCVKQRVLLPGSKTIPEQIVDNKVPYYEAIEAADQRYQKSGFREDVVAEMEELLTGMLANQLANIHQDAVT